MPTPATAAKSPSRRLDLLVIVLALVIRSASMFAFYEDLSADPDGYRSIANLLWETGEYRRPTAFDLPDSMTNTIVTAYRPPLYPLLLALTNPGQQVSDEVLARLHVLWGVLTVWGSYRLAIAWKLGRWSLLAAGLVALDPILLRQASLAMTETLAALLTVSVLLALTQYHTRRDTFTAALAGAALALACLCRPTFLPWLALIALTICFGSLLGRSPSTSSEAGSLPLMKLRHAFALIMVFALTMLPWVVRNYAQFGRPILATTHGGYTLLLGNNPEFYDYLRQSEDNELWDAESSQMGSDYRRIERIYEGDELAVDQWANARAKQNIAQQPILFAYASVVKAGRFWQLMPHRLARSESTARFMLRLAVGLWYGVLFACALVGCIALRTNLIRSPWLWGMLLIVSLTAVHTIYWSNMRMRAPVMPVVCLLAVVGVQSMWRKRSSPGK
jgi:4-amino-4-deoxy-L-arabinose transferase-like glycosyltransferase